MKKKRSTILTVLCILIALLVVGYVNGRAKTTEAQQTPQPDTNGFLSILPAPQQSEPPAASEQPAEPSPDAETPSTAPDDAQPTLDEEGKYNSKEDVALYIHTFGHLPPNYVTKAKARDAGWYGGSLEKSCPGCSIGGDVFDNREGLLPAKKGRTYYECDIDTAGESSRGAKRIVFSNDGLIYYTDDHYKSFTLLYGEDGR